MFDFSENSGLWREKLQIPGEQGVRRLGIQRQPSARSGRTVALSLSDRFGSAAPLESH